MECRRPTSTSSRCNSVASSGKCCPDTLLAWGKTNKQTRWPLNIMSYIILEDQHPFLDFQNGLMDCRSSFIDGAVMKSKLRHWKQRQQKSNSQSEMCDPPPSPKLSTSEPPCSQSPAPSDQSSTFQSGNEVSLQEKLLSVEEVGGFVGLVSFYRG